MFAYCNNNPVVFIDSLGTATQSNLTDDVNLGTVPWKGNGSGGATLLAIGAVILGFSLLYRAKELHNKKPVNLPSWKKLTVDINHILTGHFPGGSRNNNGNKGVFYGMTVEQLLKTIEEAYNNAEKVKTQFDNIKVLGYSQIYNIWIEIWIDISKRIITTAYPKG